MLVCYLTLLLNKDNQTLCYIIMKVTPSSYTQITVNLLEILENDYIFSKLSHI